jgi:hypothetical protein
MTNETFCKLDDNAKQYWLDGARNAVLMALQKSAVPHEQWVVVLGVKYQRLKHVGLNLITDKNRHQLPIRLGD